MTPSNTIAADPIPESGITPGAGSPASTGPVIFVDPGAIRLLPPCQFGNQLSSPVMLFSIGILDERLVHGMQGLGERVIVVVEACFTQPRVRGKVVMFLDPLELE